VSKSTIVAVVPAFNPDINFGHRMSALCEQVGFVVVVDDGSNGSGDWATGLRDLETVVFVRQDNEGIAAAINEGIRLALSHDPDIDYVLTVDQDSTICSGYVRNAERAYGDAIQSGVDVGAVCAEQFNDWWVTPRRSVCGVRTTLEVAQSGMLFPISTVGRFGVFDAGLFIDCVDTEYALRMLKSGAYVVMGEGCQMKHEVGETLEVRLAGRSINIFGRALKFSFHTAVRRYYISRNRLQVYRRYFWADPAWNLREILYESRAFILSMIFGPEKKQQALAVWLGLMDGARGTSGRATARRLASLGTRQ
jgi:rhamnosyltransferase